MCAHGVRVEGRDFVLGHRHHALIQAWIFVKTGVITLVPGEYRTWVLCQGTKCEHCLRQHSRLVPGYGARVRYSLGTNVNTPKFQVPRVLIKCRQPAKNPDTWRFEPSTFGGKMVSRGSENLKLPKKTELESRLL